MCIRDRMHYQVIHHTPGRLRVRCGRGMFNLSLIHISLRVLRMALDCVDGKVSTKSGIMLGLGETEDCLLYTSRCV